MDSHLTRISIYKKMARERMERGISSVQLCQTNEGRDGSRYSGLDGTSEEEGERDSALRM